MMPWAATFVRAIIISSRHWKSQDDGEQDRRGVDERGSRDSWMTKKVKYRNRQKVLQDLQIAAWKR